MANPFLSNLGVPALDQARPPTVKGFPQGLNTNNVAQWTTAVHQLVPSGSSEKDWATVLRTYVDLCEKFGVHPFANISVSNNTKIENILFQSRQDFVRFVNKYQFFEKIRIRSTHHKVTMTDEGFVLTVYAKSRIEDPSFVDWVLHLPVPYYNFAPPKPRTPDHRWNKQISPYLTLWLQNVTVNFAERWLVGYDIVVPIRPQIVDNELASRAELERFVLDVMWMPLIRALRPVTMDHRLI